MYHSPATDSGDGCGTVMWFRVDMGVFAFRSPYNLRGPVWAWTPYLHLVCGGVLMVSMGPGVSWVLAPGVSWVSART